MGARDSLDRFYTSDDTVAKCLAALDVDAYSLIIEPSAGAGAFSSALPQDKTIAMDVAPGSPSVERGDFLSFSIPAPKRGGQPVRPILVAGNPPFGLRGSLAKRFIEHAIGIGADTIAFVLPDTFRKYTNQRVFPDDWRLVSIIDLSESECTFRLASDDAEANAERDDGGDTGERAIYIPCSFFVWTRNELFSPGKDLRDYKAEQPAEFSYLRRGDANADFSINGNNGRTKDLSEITNPKAEHYIKVSPGYDVSDVRSRLDSLSYDFRSSVNGGVAWISQNDINKAFNAARGNPE